MTKRLTRSTDDKWISGVCGGIAAYTGVDATVIRLISGAALVFTGFFPAGIVYLLAWALRPKDR